MIKERYEKLLAYMKTVKQGGISAEILDISLGTLCMLIDFMNNKGLSLRIPNACSGESDNFMYVWSDDQHYLECEIFTSKIVEFFYKDRVSNTVWGLDTYLSKSTEDNLIFTPVEEYDERDKYTNEELIELLIERLKYFSVLYIKE